MTVRAKFRVNSITQYEAGSSKVTLTPVTSGSPENELFYKWTPSGTIELSTLNESAAAQFKVGTEMYVDFTRASAD